MKSTHQVRDFSTAKNSRTNPFKHTLYSSTLILFALVSGAAYAANPFTETVHTFLFGAKTANTTSLPRPASLTVAVPGLLGSYATQGLAGTTAAILPSDTAANVTFSELARGPGLVPASFSNALSSSGWSTSPVLNIADGDYYEFTITPDTAFQFSAAEIRLGLSRSTTGPDQAELRSSLDGFAGAIGGVLTVSTLTSRHSIDLSAVAGLQNSSSAVTFRLYGYHASGSGGTLRIERISGTTTPVVGIEVDGIVSSMCGAPEITLQPTDVTTTYGNGDIIFTTAFAGETNPTIAWEVSTGGGGSWNPFGGADGTELIISTPTAAMNGYQFRAVFVYDCGGTQTAVTDPATLTVHKAAALIAVNSYNTTYNGNPQISAGTALGGYGGDLSSLLDLSGTIHTNAGEYTGDVWNFAGDANHLAAAGTVDNNIGQAVTTTGITADTPDPSETGQSYTVSWSVEALAPGDGTPAGTVTVDDGHGNFCSAAVSAGSCSLISTISGTITLTAAYGGDANFHPSLGTASHEVEVTESRSTNTSVICAPGSIVLDGVTTCTVTVTDTAAGSASTPTGLVEWSSDNTGLFAPAGCILSGSGASASCSVDYSANAVNSHTITAAYSGDSGHSGSGGSFSLNVLYDFDGFFSPVANLPVVNIVKAGQTVPIKWKLTGAFADHIRNPAVASSIQYYQVRCAANEMLENPITETDAGTGENSGLRYDLTGEQFIFTWKTNKNFAGKCLELLVMFDDGTSRSATFKFTR